MIDFCGCSHQGLSGGAHPKVSYQDCVFLTHDQLDGILKDNWCTFVSVLWFTHFSVFHLPSEVLGLGFLCCSSSKLSKSYSC